MNTALSGSRIAGANDSVALGVIGCGGRGNHVASHLPKDSKVRVLAVCGVYGARIDKALEYAKGAVSFYRHEKLLEMREIDAVLIGTPDHRVRR